MSSYNIRTIKLASARRLVLLMSCQAPLRSFDILMPYKLAYYYYAVYIYTQPAFRNKSPTNKTQLKLSADKHRHT